MENYFHRRGEEPGKVSATAAASSMKTVIQVMSHGTSDCPAPALVLQTANGQRHLFGGIGEGFQRTVTQNKIKMAKLNNIFLSGRLDWSTIGGLPGLLLTIADQGVTSIGVHSATKNLAWACAVWRHFIFRQGIQLRPNELAKPYSHIHEDEYFMVAGVPVSNNSVDPTSFPADQEEIDKLAKDFVNAMFPKNGVSSATPKKNAKPRSPSPVNKVKFSSKLPDLSAYDSRSTCYIIQMKSTRGKFQVQKAKQLGVPPGPLFSKLTKGESVQTPDGRTITPDQVLAAPIKGPRVLIIDCPSSEYIESVMAQDWLQSLRKPDSQEEGMQEKEDSRAQKRRRTDGLDSEFGLTEKPSVVYHLLGKSVDPFSGAYFDWMTSDAFTPTCLHFITHPDYAPDGISLDAAALLNIKLRYLYPDNFRVLHTADAIKKFPTDADSRIHPMLTLGTVGIEPVVAYNRSYEKCNGKVNWGDIEPEVLDPLRAKLEAANLSLPLQAPLPDIPEEHLKDVEVITLGTGSALPSKYRNVISTLVRVKPGSRKSIMFDCGEATLGNMRRMYGPLAEEMVKEIAILYLSHLHADHHLGAISVIKEWLRVTDAEDKLYVMGPWKYFQFLSEWSQLEPAVNMGRLRFVDNESCMQGHSYLVNAPNPEVPEKVSEEHRFEITKTPSWIEEMKSEVGVTSVRTCKARHCDLAYCVSMNFRMDGEKKGFQVSYSGDTRPTNFFAYRVGQNSDLLIHEATLENGMEGEAAKKNHSTIGQALDIAYRMKSKYTVLTHFSQRYPKLPNIDCTVERKPDISEEDAPLFEEDQDQEQSDQKIALAFDGLKLKLKDIAPQKLKYEQLKLVFAEVEEEEVAMDQAEA